MNTSTSSLFFTLLFLLTVTKFGEGIPFKAGVVEYHYKVEPTSDPKQILLNNVKKYVELVKKFSNEETYVEDGILVFPECGLSDESHLDEVSVLVPEPNNQNNNFTGNEVLDLLSKAAIKYWTWLVVNLVEKDGNKYYNTDVVFNCNGTIAAKYRKFNLFGEPLNHPDKPESVRFTTNFNVTFGIFTCFDIMYQHPALDLVAKGVKHIIFPTAWYSELPFLTAVQYQKGWSWANNVTLLAAGLSFADTGNTGTGIYLARTGHDLYYQTTYSNESKLLMAVLDSQDADYFRKLDVLTLSPALKSVKEGKKEYSQVEDVSNFLESESREDGHQNIKPEALVKHGHDNSDVKKRLFLKSEPLTAYTTTLIGPNRCKVPKNEFKTDTVANCTKNIVKTLCNHKFCCDFNVTATFSVYICKGRDCIDAMKYRPPLTSQDDFSQSKYRLAAFNGVRSFDVTTGGAQVCAVVSCRNETLASCGLTPKQKDLDCFRYDRDTSACILGSHISHVNISGKFSENHTFITPNILLKSNKSSNQFGKITNDFQLTDTDGYYSLVYNASPKDYVGTVGIWSRMFDRDGQSVTGSSPSFSPSILIALSLILFYPILKILRSH